MRYLAMSAQVFPHTSCESHGHSGTMDLDDDQYADNVDALADSLGANQECIQQAHSASGSSSSGSSSMFHSNAESSQFAESSSYQQGCSSVFMDTKTIVDKTRSMNCTLSQSAAETSATVSANASITVKVTTDPEYEAILAETYNKALEEYNALAALCITSNSNLTECLQAIVSMKPVNVLAESGIIRMSNTDLKVSTTTKMNMITQNTSQAVNSVKEDFTDIVTTAAANALEQTTGFQSLNENTKTAISQIVDTRSEDIDNNITQVLTHTKLNVSNNSAVVIEAPRSIIMDNVTISANIAIDIASSCLTSSAIELGKEIAATVMKDTTSNNSSLTDTAGAEDFVEEVGNAAEKQTALTMEAAQASTFGASVEGIGNATKSVLEGAGSFVESAASGLSGLLGVAIGASMLYVIGLILIVPLFLFILFKVIKGMFSGGKKMAQQHLPNVANMAQQHMPNVANMAQQQFSEVAVGTPVGPPHEMNSAPAASPDNMNLATQPAAYAGVTQETTTVPPPWVALLVLTLCIVFLMVLALYRKRLRNTSEEEHNQEEEDDASTVPAELETPDEPDTPDSPPPYFSVADDDRDVYW